LRGYGVELPFVMEVDGSPVLVAGYVAERQDFIPTALRVHAWSLDFRRLPPDIRLCTFLTGENRRIKRV
jgi:hypothetical protein